MAVTESREVLIEATPEQIMDVLLDLESVPEWSPAHHKVQILERDDQGRPTKSRQVVKVVGIADEQVLAYSIHDDGLSWTLVSAKLRRGQDARYTLTRDGDATRVHVELTIDLTVPVPGFLIKKGAKGLMETATEGLRQRVLEVKKGGK
jgi:ribosome-associated toxin RatA of RatAB toxin-antitoxin module